jgi:hypothetical protein
VEFHFAGVIEHDLGCDATHGILAMPTRDLENSSLLEARAAGSLRQP